MTTRDDPTHYELLGVPEDASTDEIKKAYRKLSRATHPDVNPAAGKLFTLVNRAHDILSDPSKRAEYDRQLKNPAGSYSHPAPEEQAPPEHAEPAWGDEAAWDATSGDEEVPAFVMEEGLEGTADERRTFTAYDAEQQQAEALGASKKKMLTALGVTGGALFLLFRFASGSSGAGAAYLILGLSVLSFLLLAVWVTDNEVTGKMRLPRYLLYIITLVVLPGVLALEALSMGDWTILIVYPFLLVVALLLPHWTAGAIRNHLRLMRAES